MSNERRKSLFSIRTGMDLEQLPPKTFASAQFKAPLSGITTHNGPLSFQWRCIVMSDNEDWRRVRCEFRSFVLFCLRTSFCLNMIIQPSRRGFDFQFCQWIMIRASLHRGEEPHSTPQTSADMPVKRIARVGNSSRVLVGVIATMMMVKMREQPQPLR